MNTSPSSNTGRKTRYDKGQVLLTERDLHVLRWIAEQYAARFDQVQELLGKEAGPGASNSDEISASAARQVIARWRRGGWVVCRKVFAFEQPWLHVTPLGLRLLDLPYKSNTPSVTRLLHLFAVNEVRLGLALSRPTDQWISERTLRTQLFPVNGGSLPHLPDGKLLTAEGSVAIEAELTPKAPRELLAILQELTDTSVEVWYFAAHEAHAGVVSARAKLPESQAWRVQVYCYPEYLYEDEGQA